MLYIFTSKFELKVGENNQVSWTFAQLVAVTLWVPSILEYLYAAFRGIDNLMDHRMAPGYYVVKEDEGSYGKA